MTDPLAADTRGTGFGHGKIILLGEHAVVHGHPALAAGMDRGIRARIAPGTGLIQVPAWSFQCAVGDQQKPAQAVRTILGIVAPSLDLQGHDVIVEAEIPHGAGLGSSAALATAVARAAASLVEARPEQIASAVGAAETIFHGNPSGIDAAAAAAAGLGVYSRTGGWQPLDAHSIKVCVGNTGQARETSTLVASVSSLAKRNAIARGVLDLLGDASRAGIDAVNKGDIDELGRLFDLAHGLLAGLRTSSPQLDAMVHAARAAGAIGAKLTGAGGGGSVIALAPSHSDDVLARWADMGFTGFVTRLGIRDRAKKTMPRNAGT